METKDFWENVKNYDEEIISVFVTKNTLTQKLQKIKNKDKKVIAWMMTRKIIRMTRQRIKRNDWRLFIQ